MIARAVEVFGRIDVLVNNADYQMARQSLEEVPDWEWDHTIATNLTATFHLCKAAIPHLGAGSSIVNTTSIQEDQSTPILLPYATTAGDHQLHGEPGSAARSRDIRVNSVAPGPIWTPLIPATMPGQAVEVSGDNTPLGRVGQPAEVAPAFVLLARTRAATCRVRTSRSRAASRSSEIGARQERRPRQRAVRGQVDVDEARLPSSGEAGLSSSDEARLSSSDEATPSHSRAESSVQRSW